MSETAMYHTNGTSCIALISCTAKNGSPNLRWSLEMKYASSPPVFSLSGWGIIAAAQLRESPVGLMQEVRQQLLEASRHTTHASFMPHQHEGAAWQSEKSIAREASAGLSNKQSPLKREKLLNDCITMRVGRLCTKQRSHHPPMDVPEC